jgi:UDP-N-acetylmuramate dehydrogenase
MKLGGTLPAMPSWIRDHVPLAPFTSLELGGPARFFADVTNEAQIREALDFAQQKDLPVFILGGGSNLVVADEGFPGLVLHTNWRGLRFHEQGCEVRLECAAGETWDEVVAASVQRGLSGLECLSGIPGRAGSTPIQNVGAYGHETADTLHSVRVLDRQSRDVRELPASTCGFSYRHSMFKDVPDRYVVLSLTFTLRPGVPQIRYQELARSLADTAEPTPAQVRDIVLRLRAQKSMVVDPLDPNRRSAGSFFTNPVVSPAEAQRVVQQAMAENLVRAPEDMPRYPAGDGRVKLAAGWLIEKSGITRGLRRGHVGVSGRHALALVHHGGGSTAELIHMAVHVRDAVARRFGVTLRPEPVFLGTRWPDA